MKSHPPTPEPPIQPQLAYLLRGVARELRAARLHKRGIRRWASAAVIAFVLLEIRHNSAGFAPYSLYALILLLVVALARSYQVAKADKLDLAEAARAIEETFPDLRQALRTAVEQKPQEGGRYDFLQARVITSALKHANLNNWRKQPQNRARWNFAGYAVAVAAALTLTLGPALLQLAHKNFPIPAITLPHYGVTVSPGNKEVERGANVIIAARFDGRIPREAQLVWKQPDGKNGVILMSRSLSDPVFAYTLPVVNRDTVYSIKYGNSTTAEFTLKVFDQPALLKADATLDYPAYTTIPQKTIPDTRRVSAVTGTKLEYDFTMNKPMKDVTLTDDKGNDVPVTATNPERTHFSMNLTIEQTQRLTMHLTDNDGRPNPAPTDLRITAVPTQRPVVRVTFPMRDQRVSPLEEVHVQASARDQFGLVDYGLAFSVGADDPQFISLHAADAAKTTQIAFNNTLKLEPKGVEPGQLVTWFAWADDYGPDGQVRRTTSELAFAEVRPFEMIFHEDATAGQQQQRQPRQPGQQPQSNNPAQDLLELEREISVATWNLKQQDKPTPTFKEDVATLKQSQDEAISQLADVAEQARTPTQQAAAADAAKFMKQAADNLASAGDKTSLDPLTPAWSGAQGAYQALLKLQGREFRVSQQRGGQGQQQQRNRMQQQIDQLQFRNQQNRYQAENTAQDPASQEQRNQMEAQSRLNDLARRQQDLNQRLQEMQTALAAAQDQQQRDEIQRELQRLQEEQRNMLTDLDEARQNVDQMQAGQQTDQARQQLDQARENMRQAGEQLAQQQVSEALASGTRADQSLQQTSQNLRRDSSSRFANQMQTAQQQARDLSNTQQENGQQLDQLAQKGAQSLDDTQQRQALAQSYAQQAQNLTNLMDQLKQVAEQSETNEPGLSKQLSDLLRQQSSATTADDLKNSSNLLRNGLVDQTRPLQNSAAQNLDRLRAGVERAAQSVLGDDTAALRFAQNELNDLTRQLQLDQPANSEQFRDAGQAPAPAGDTANQNASTQNGPPNGQRGQGAQNGQGGQLAQDNNSNSFRDAGNNSDRAGQQPGGRQGGQGLGDPTNDQLAQNGRGGQQGDQPGQQPGNGQQGRGQSGQRGQGARGRGQGGQPGEQQTAQNGQGGQRGQGAQGPSQGDQASDQQTAQNSQGGQRGPGGARGQGGPRGQGGQRGQGGAGQAGGEGDQQLAQNDNAVDQSFDPGQPAAGSGQRGGQRGQRGQGGPRGQAGQRGQGGTGQPDQLAQNGQGSGRNGGNGARGNGRGGNGNNFNGGGGYDNGGFNGGYETGNYANVTGPITGNNFADWNNRLGIVQNLIDDPQLRQQIANARAQATTLRADYLRHSQSPKWDVVDSNVVTPLTKVITALHQQLARTDQPDSLQPVDQDPVPEKYADAVKRYYEALGN